MLNVLLWCGGIVVAIYLLWKVGLPLTGLVLCMFGKDTAPCLRPCEQHDQKPWSKRLARARQQAIELGFSDAGVFTEGGRGQIGLMLSEDRRTMLALTRWGLSNCFLQSFPNDRLMIRTRYDGPNSDLSGMIISESLPTQRLDVAYAFHLERVAKAGPAVQLDPRRLREWTVAFEERRMRALIEAGLAWSRGNDAFSMTWKGAKLQYKQLFVGTTRRFEEDRQRASNAEEAFDAARQALAKEEAAPNTDAALR